MKKITLLLLFLCSVFGYGQIETFEGGIPASWAVMTGTNGLGSQEQWKLNPPATYPAYQGTNAAYVNNWNVLDGNTEQDWLVMNQRLVPVNGQLRFYVRQTQSGNQLTRFQIRVSTSADQMNQGNYRIIRDFSEGQLNNLNGDLTQYEEKVVSFKGVDPENNDYNYDGQQVYVAFVRVHTQTGPARGGERFLVDNVNIVPECIKPLAATSSNIGATTATFSWTGEATGNYQLEIVPGSSNADFLPPFTAASANTVNVTGLLSGTILKYYVRKVCTDGDGNPYYSDWSDAHFFTTLPKGSICSAPLVIDVLPYQTSGTTSTYGDNFDTTQGNFASCGASPATTNYFGGDDVFYSYTATQGGNVSITLTPGVASPNSSIFVYNACSGIGAACVGGMANANSTVRSFVVAMQANQTYIIVISSNATTQSINYGLLIQQENCIPKPIDGIAQNTTINSADLSWNPQSYSSWQVQVQTLGGIVPSGPGADIVTGTPSFTKGGLDPGTFYQYWVRAECNPGAGIYTAWAGPFFFNTAVCAPGDACTYTFRLTDSQSNGWGATRMQVRQNGIVVATLGDQMVTGFASVDVPVQICPNVPFDLFWLTAGPQPTQCGVVILNSFGQTLYTRASGTNGTNTILYEGVGKCDVPRCDLPPVNVSVSNITTTTVNLKWTAVATTAWDVFVLPGGSAAPLSTDVPPAAFPFANISAGTPGLDLTDPNSPVFTITGLTPDTPYTFYVRVVCNPEPSAPSPAVNGTTIPTCIKPGMPTVPIATITLENASISWTAGQPGVSNWEVLLIPGPAVPAAPPVNPVVGGGTILFTTTTNTNVTSPTPLTPATIYYVYVRTVCPGDDKSTWTGPTKFNTVLCNAADKCTYKFVLTNTSGNSWNNGRMEVRQNGIVVATLGTSLINNPAGVPVDLCPGINYDLYWSVPGNVPANIGVSIQNPFLDVLYTKAPGSGTPLNVLYSSTVNCTQAPCAKPKEMTAGNITHNSAVLSWVDQSVPASTLYDLYVVLTGGPAPINDPATVPTIAGVPNNYLITTIDGTIALLPSTSYTYYVRAVCGPGVTSTWTILSPYTFVTKPVNDECGTATTVTVNSAQTCLPANTVQATTYGATASLPAGTSDVGCGTTDDDVWFKFEALRPSQTLNFSNIVGTPNNITINHSVFSGPCNNLVKISCSNALTSDVTGLTVGQIYYVRVYTPGTNLAQFANFSLCITSPPANDECIASTAVTVNTGQVCLSENSVSGNTFGATASSPVLTPPLTGAGCGATNRDLWYSFVAGSTAQTIILSDIVPTPASATSLRLNLSVFSGTCTNLTRIICSTTNTTPVTGLTAGETYYVRVYTATTVVGQSATFKMCIISPPVNDECLNATTVSVSPGQECSPTTTVTGTTLGATPSSPVLTPPLAGGGCGLNNNDVWYKFVATSTSHGILLSNISPTPSNATIAVNYSLFSGSCASLTKINCYTTTTSVVEGLVVGQTYYIRVYTATINTEQSIRFNLCITSPPVNNECANATPVPVNPAQTCLPANIVSGNTFGATASLPILTPPLTGAGCGQTNNDIWYSFVATATSHAITLSNIVPTPLTINNFRLNYSVFSGTCGNGNLTRLYCSTTNTSNATGLTVGATYYIRVYNSTTNAGQSATFDLCITSPPVNDTCATAIQAPTNPTSTCFENSYGSTLGASLSLPTVTGTGCTGTDDDVWYKFTATSTTHFINVNILTASGGAVSLSHSVLSGTCDTLTNMYCSTNSSSVATNLTIGNVYYIRIYTAGTAVGDWATFKLCIKTPPPPATNDNCITAIPVTVNTSSGCTFTTQGNIIGATASGAPGPACQGNSNDDVWFSFQAVTNQHFINLLNVEGTSANLNHAVYSGTCGALVNLYCSAANSLTSTNTNFVPGQTYYVRVWSNSGSSQIVMFDLCVKSVSTCETAEPFCGSGQSQSLLFPNTTSVASLGNVACLNGTPNPTFYYLQVGQTGNLTFEIRQSTDPNNFPTTGAPGLDVDFAAWGPFTDPQSCSQIAFADCPGCPNNQDDDDPLNPIYPVGNIVDCSWSADVMETLRIPNAVAGQYYLILITNWNGAAGYIKLFQSNFGVPGSGVSTNLCCDVAFGQDITTCATSVVLDALQESETSSDAYQWYFENEIIPNATSSTYTATQSGRYKVVGVCGINSDTDEIIVTLLPEIVVTPVSDQLLCDGTNNDNKAEFNLSLIDATALGIDPSLYQITYHAIENDAISDLPGLDPSVLYSTVSTTIYVRIERNTLSTCYKVVPVNLVVAPIPDARFTYATQYCSYDTNPFPTMVGVIGEFWALPSGLDIVQSTGEIKLLTSTPGTYTVYNKIVGTTANQCPNVQEQFTVTIVAKPNFTLSGSLSICPEGSTTISAVPTNSSYDPALVTYKWFYGTTELSSTGASLSLTGSATTLVEYGDYSVEINNQGCTNTQVFTISNSNTTWNVTLGSSAADLCGNETAVLTAAVTNNTAGSPVTYRFTRADMSTVENTTGTLTIDAPGVYSVSVDILGCTSTPQSITIGEGTADWAVSFVNAPYVICPNQPVTLSFTATNFDINDPAATYTWTRPDATEFVGRSLTVTAFGNYTLTVDILGCAIAIPVTVSEDTTVVSIGFESGCENNVYVVRAVSLNNSFDPLTSTYDWNGPKIVPTVPAEAAAIGLGAKGMYSVTVTTAEGCKASKDFDAQDIVLGCTIMKGISPNNDTKNDKFDLSAYNVKHLSIFNRYGTEVYKYDNYTDQWSGQTNSGEELPDGTYFYVIDKADGKSQSGWIYINR